MAFISLISSSSEGATVVPVAAGAAGFSLGELATSADVRAKAKKQNVVSIKVSSPQAQCSGATGFLRNLLFVLPECRNDAHVFKRCHLAFHISARSQFPQQTPPLSVYKTSGMPHMVHRGSSLRQIAWRRASDV